MEEIHPMRFVHEFLNFVQDHGIYDEFDPEENAMVTSDEVQELIVMALEVAGERKTPEAADKAMRALNDSERDFFIANDREDVIIDMRSVFAEKMAINGGARGLLAQIVDAQERGDILEAKRLLTLAKEFSEHEAQ